MTSIHATAIVEDGAILGAGVSVGPYCHIGPQVRLDEGVRLHSHVVLAGDTHIGAQCEIFPFASIGHKPQDLKYAGEPVTLEIGARCIIREGVTINPGTAGGGGRTTIGERCALLANSHVGHDSHIGNGVILSNNVMIAGHVSVDDHAIISGGAGIHQFSRIGEHAFVGGLSGVENDVIPYGMALGNRAHLGGLNLIGLKRRNFSRDDIHALRNAYKEVFGKGGTLVERARRARDDYSGVEPVQKMAAFILDAGDRRFCTPRPARGSRDE